MKRKYLIKPRKKYISWGILLMSTKYIEISGLLRIFILPPISVLFLKNNLI